MKGVSLNVMLSEARQSRQFGWALFGTADMLSLCHTFSFVSIFCGSSMVQSVCCLSSNALQWWVSRSHQRYCFQQHLAESLGACRIRWLMSLLTSKAAFIWTFFRITSFHGPPRVAVGPFSLLSSAVVQACLSLFDLQP